MRPTRSLTWPNNDHSSAPSQQEPEQEGEKIQLAEQRTQLDEMSDLYRWVRAESALNNICRFCMNPGDNLIVPCNCKGSMKFVHNSCLIKWIIHSDKKQCEICKYEYQIKESRRPIYLWGFSGVSRTDIRRCVRGILMLLIALASLVGGVFLIFMDSEEELNSAAHPANVTSPTPLVEKDREAFFGKLAIIAFTLLGTAFFLVVQCTWFKKFYDKLARVNREIKIDAKKQRLSTIIEEGSSLPSSWNSRDSVVSKA
ncbi:Oidioi.mRNA.OKI2018_I69.XSR.g13361.t1.cds [Oikopleura dioica]|uniref:Oidioi.mRNA.OKI2018_I69.XSR.g13361.t1.cds n=1 Tax=Oikopleura dioica TaxID=34765 RepID=A0ABN7S6N0_OIKDI|nr:Oidioi.mRNA.OKI2018_I69.XSR.g13361.t1.cds [Oikopleura dioica]